MQDDAFDQLVKEVLETLPQELRHYLPPIAILVEAAPSPALLQRLGIGPGFTLRGLYQGVPLSKRGYLDVPRLPDSITIFQQPLEALGQTHGEIAALVRETVLHELGHYFGFDEAQIRALLS